MYSTTRSFWIGALFDYAGLSFNLVFPLFVLKGIGNEPD